MAILPLWEIVALLEPFASVPVELGEQLSAYLDLLVKWNERTNLTAIRDPREMVRRHFGESLFAASLLPACETLLDFGSGAGFPGLPIQLAKPGLKVTLAESQNKKAGFLREAVRVLGLETEVWAGRVDGMPVGRRFDVVTLRAVDDPLKALAEARERVRVGGVVVHLTTTGAAVGERKGIPGSLLGVMDVVRV